MTTDPDDTPQGRRADVAQDDTPVTLTGDDVELDSLIAAVAAAPSVPAPGLATILRDGDVVDGSYRIERLLGRGGMGSVFLARDLDLDRFVAVKVHRGAIREHEVARLSREARVMARLSHPNVVAVYEVGTHEGALFVVMEYVDGGTLRGWVGDATRSWREIVEIVLTVSQGIVAAHEIGVIHRDLKPENVLVGRDGRARVADFGLARWQRSVATPADSAELASERGRPEDLERYTVTGAIAGTPAYMSPEQFAGLEVGPASDQFSLCVILYEALFGRRPFAGNSTLQLAHSVLEGEVQPVPPRADVPRALVEVILRGLRSDPKERHASVAALGEALRRVLGQRRRRIVASVGGTLLLAATIAGFSAASALNPELCEDADAPLAQVWNAERRDAVRDAVAESDVALAEAVVARIDEHAAEWSARRRAACEDSRVTGERSDFELGLRTACLDRMLARIDGLVVELAERGGDETLDEPLVRSMLPDLAQCDDVDALDRRINRFATRSIRDSSAQDRAWAEAGRLLTRARTRYQLGRGGYAPLAEEAMGLAQAHGLLDVELSATLLLAEAARERGDAEQATEKYARAAQLAAATGDIEGALEVMLSRAQGALAEGRLDEAQVHMQYFDDYLPRASQLQGAASLEQRGQILHARLALVRGDDRRAIALLEPAIAGMPPGSADRAPALQLLGGALLSAGRVEQARDVFAEIVASEEARLGPVAVDVGILYNALGVAQTNLGEADAAARSLDRALDIATAAGPEGAELRASAIENQGAAALARGDLEEAEALLRQALALRTEALGPEHPALASVLEDLGEVLRRKGGLDEALSSLERSMALYDAAYGPGSARVATTLTRMGLVFVAQGRADTAAKALRAALQIREEHDADPVRWAETEVALASVIEGAAPEEAARLRDSARARVQDVGKYAAPVLDALR